MQQQVCCGSIAIILHAKNVAVSTWHYAAIELCGIVLMYNNNFRVSRAFAKTHFPFFLSG